MFIICNGAFKSGSTWLFLIVKEMLQIKEMQFNEKIRPKWQSNSNPNFLFNDQNITKALAAYNRNDKNYLSKVHLLEEESYKIISATDDNVKLLFIKRDIGDAVVSHYHHITTEIGYSIPFSLYYWFIGRFKVKEIASFELNRKKYVSDALNICYEDLKSDFFSQVVKIADYLGIEIADDEILLIKKRTDINILRGKAKQGEIHQYSDDKNKAAKHFRKGSVGDSKEILTRRQKSDIEKIKNNNTSVVLDSLYFLLFNVRRKIYKL